MKHPFVYLVVFILGCAFIPFMFVGGIFFHDFTSAVVTIVGYALAIFIFLLIAGIVIYVGLGIICILAGAFHVVKRFFATK